MRYHRNQGGDYYRSQLYSVVVVFPMLRLTIAGTEGGNEDRNA
jgi:hypothetical protein